MLRIVRYDQIDGQVHLDAKHIRERLRAAAMKKIRDKFPDWPEKWHISKFDDLRLGFVKKGYSKETGDSIYTFYLEDYKGTKWAEANYEVLT